jgi:predicted RNA-binding Zn-ribbon protein involved in translation (DUF1610 family)
MRRDCLIYRTKQTWKLHAMTIGCVIAIVCLFVIPWLLNDSSEHVELTYWILGTVAPAAGLSVAFFTIRCPACGARWMTRAAKQHSSKWLQWLSTLQECPDCGAKGERAT